MSLKNWIKQVEAEKLNEMTGPAGAIVVPTKDASGKQSTVMIDITGNEPLKAALQSAAKSKQVTAVAPPQQAATQPGAKPATQPAGTQPATQAGAKPATQPAGTQQPPAAQGQQPMQEEEVMEVAPPGMEDVVLALKKKFPGQEGRAYAIAWSQYNKKHGKKEESMHESVSTNKKPIMEGTLEEILSNHPHEHKMCKEGWGMHESLYEALCDHYFKEGRIPRSVWHGPAEHLRKHVEECYMQDTLEEGWKGALAGGLAGAALGSVAPGFGTLAGGLAGAYAGHKLGDEGFKDPDAAYKKAQADKQKQQTVKDGSVEEGGKIGDTLQNKFMGNGPLEEESRLEQRIRDAAMRHVKDEMDENIMYENKKQLAEKDLGKHNNATTGFKALAKKAGKAYGSKAAGERVAGAQLAKMRKAGQLEEGQAASKFSPEMHDRIKNATPRQLSQMASTFAGPIGHYEYELELLQQAQEELQGVAKENMEESGLQAYLGNKKYGEKGMNALRKAGREGASKQKMANIRAKYDKLDEELMETGNGSRSLEDILDLFPQEVAKFKKGHDLDYDLYTELFDYYFNNGEMPYGIAKARTGDPVEWVTERLYNDMEEQLDEGKGAIRKFLAGLGIMGALGAYISSEDEAILQKMAQKYEQAETPQQRAQIKRDIERVTKGSLVKEEDMEEALHGHQKNIDMNHNGKIDAEDLKMLRRSKGATKEVSEATKKTTRGRIHTADAGGYGRKDDEDDEGKKVASTVKKGRGRPKKGGDETGDVKKYDFTGLSSVSGSKMPKDTKKGNRVIKGKAQSHADNKEKDDEMMESWDRQLKSMLNEDMRMAIPSQVYGDHNQQQNNAAHGEILGALQALLHNAGMSNGRRGMSAPGEQHAQVIDVQPQAPNEVQVLLATNRDSVADGGDDLTDLISRLRHGRNASAEGNAKATLIVPHGDYAQEEGHDMHGTFKEDAGDPEGTEAAAGHDDAINAALAGSYHADQSVNQDKNLAVSEEALDQPATFESEEVGGNDITRLMKKLDSLLDMVGNKDSDAERDDDAEEAGEEEIKAIEYDDGHDAEDDNEAEKAGKEVTKDIEADEDDLAEGEETCNECGVYESKCKCSMSESRIFTNLLKMFEEKSDERDDKAERAGKKVTKDIEYDEGHKSKDDEKAERAGKKVTKDIEYDEKKKVKESDNYERTQRSNSDHAMSPLSEKKKIDEWANSPQGKSEDESFTTDIDFMTKVISGGLNNMKQDQTVLPSARVVTKSESNNVDTSMAAQLRKLAGIN